VSLRDAGTAVHVLGSLLLCMRGRVGYRPCIADATAVKQGSPFPLRAKKEGTGRGGLGTGPLGSIPGLPSRDRRISPV